MYTLHPEVGTFNSHTQFYFIVAVCILFAIIWVGLLVEDNRKEKRELGTVVRTTVPSSIFLLFAISAVVSFTTGTVPANVQVKATLVKNIELDERVKVSKLKYEIQPRMHVVYMTPDGEVTFPRRSGVVYPEVVILYKN